MKRTIGLAICLAVTFALATSASHAAGQSSAAAAGRVTVDQVERVHRNQDLGTPEIVSGRFTVTTGATMADRAVAFFASRSNLFRLTQPQDELELRSERTDDLGLSHLRFQQVRNGVPVWGCQTIVHFRDDQTIYLIGGQTIPTPRVTTTPTISGTVAQLHAITHLSGQYPDIELQPKTELVIYPNNGDPRLAQLVTVTSPTNGAVRRRVFVDAESSRVLYDFNDIHFDGPDTGIGLAVDGNFYSFPIYEFSGNYQLVDATRTMFVPPASNLEGVVVTYDDYYGGGPISTDPNGDKFWNDNAAQKAEVSGHHFAAITYEYFLNRFGRNSYDDAGSTILVNAHDPYYVNNAYWNGECINFADGDGVTFLPFSGDLDVVAHELTHGVTEYNGNGGLIYQHQSGAINESYSDVFGNMVDSADAAWLIGEDIVLFAPGYLRNMKDPTLRDDPKHMADYLYLPLSNDNGGVHSNSGIGNHCAYLASDVHGLGRSKMEQIWYRTLTTYMTPNSNYYFRAGMTLQSAIDLYGYGSPEMLGVEAALGDVGLGPVYAMPQTTSVGAAFGEIANQSIWLFNPGSSTGSIQVAAPVPSLPGLTISPPTLAITDGDSADFVLTLDATALDECDVGAFVDTLDFTVTGPDTTELRLPVNVYVGYTAASIEEETAGTSCVTLDAFNTTKMDRFERGGLDALYQGTLLVGLWDAGVVHTYRDVFGVQKFAPVDTISGAPGTGPISFRIASHDARVQGMVTYSSSGEIDSCGFIIAEYDLFNLCDTALTVLAGLFCDFDIDNSTLNRADYDAVDRLVYMHDQSDSHAAGMALLSGTPRNLRAIHNPSLVWGGSFTDDVAYSEMNQTANVASPIDDDWSVLLTFGQTQIGPGDTIRYAVALVYSDSGSSGLGAIVEQAESWWEGPPTCCTNPGNVDGIVGAGGPVDVADLTYLVAYVFLGGPVPPCLEEGNVDGIVGVGGPVDVADVTYLVTYLFQGGPPPPPCL